MAKKILCVDDDPMILFALQHDLGSEYLVETAPRGEQALKMIQDGGQYAVIIADMMMPGMTGVELLSRVQTLRPDTVRLMLTANEDRNTAVEAINKGSIFRFLSKPYTAEDLQRAVSNAMEQHRLITAERELLEQTFHGAVRMLSDVLSMVDPEVLGRGQKLRDSMKAVARAVSPAPLWELEIAAMLCEIGRVTIPAAILENARAGAPLTGRESAILSRVPEISANLLRNIPRLENVARIVLYQQKHFDGSGFPIDSLAGEEIPAGARLLKILQDLLELESKGVSRSQAFGEMTARAGWYDTTLLEKAREILSNDAAPGSRPIRVKFLAVGQVLAADAESGEGGVLAAAGTRLNEALIEKLKNFAELSGVKEPLRIAC